MSNITVSKCMVEIWVNRSMQEVKEDVIKDTTKKLKMGSGQNFSKSCLHEMHFFHRDGGFINSNAIKNYEQWFNKLY